MASKRASEECVMSLTYWCQKDSRSHYLAITCRDGENQVNWCKYFRQKNVFESIHFDPLKGHHWKVSCHSNWLQSATQKCVKTIFLNEHAQIEKSPKGFEIIDSHTATSDIKLTDLVSLPNNTSVNVTRYFTTWNSNSQDWEIILKARLSRWLYNLLSFSSGYPSCKTKIGTVDGLDVECTKCRLMLKLSKCKH